jgi:Holliday junction resolvase
MSRGDQLRGINRERQLAAQLTESGWWVMRAAGSHGVADLVCLHKGRRPMMLEVKSNSGSPFAGFGPAKRQALSEAAQQAGAIPYLVNWPKHGKPEWFACDQWPGSKS